MKIKFINHGSQVYWIALALFIMVSCSVKKEESPALPPLTSPLSQPYIGFGVVNVSYTRIVAVPGEEHADEHSSGGYLRRGSVVRILRRQTLKTQEKSESWVLVEGPTAGWLRETLLDIYASEAQAMTGSEAMGN